MIAVALLLMWLLNCSSSAPRSAAHPRGGRGPRGGGDHGRERRRVIALTFFLGSALGGAAGVLVGLYYTQIDFFMGYSAGLKAFTAAVLGGIGNIKGAMLGGLAARRDREPGRHVHQSGLQGRRRVRGPDPGARVPPEGCSAKRWPTGTRCDAGERLNALLAAVVLLAGAVVAPLVAPNDYVVGVLARICLYAAAGARPQHRRRLRRPARHRLRRVLRHRLLHLCLPRLARISACTCRSCWPCRSSRWRPPFSAS